MSAKLELGEPLVSDKRLAKAEVKVRKEIKGLDKFGSAFVTWTQEPLDFENEHGQMVHLDRVAVVGIFSPDPKQPEFTKMTRVALYWDEWNRLDHAGKTDPLLTFMRAAAKEHVQVMKNLSERSN